jgi:hypothetical protein
MLEPSAPLHLAALIIVDGRSTTPSVAMVTTPRARAGRVG